jgi:hypothetical protein
MLVELLGLTHLPGEEADTWRGLPKGLYPLHALKMDTKDMVLGALSTILRP